MAFRLKKEILEFIRTNQNDSYGIISQALGVKIVTIESYVIRNSRRLTEYPVLKVLSKYIGKPVQELIEEYVDDEDEKDRAEDAKITNEKIKAA